MDLAYQEVLQHITRGACIRKKGTDLQLVSAPWVNPAVEAMTAPEKDDFFKGFGEPFNVGAFWMSKDEIDALPRKAPPNAPPEENERPAPEADVKQQPASKAEGEPHLFLGNELRELIGNVITGIRLKLGGANKGARGHAPSGYVGLFLIFHPLVVDEDARDAHYPIDIGLTYQGSPLLAPQRWPKKFRAKFWDRLLGLLDRLRRRLEPKERKPQKRKPGSTEPSYRMLDRLLKDGHPAGLVADVIAAVRQVAKPDPGKQGAPLELVKNLLSQAQTDMERGKNPLRPQGRRVDREGLKTARLSLGLKEELEAVLRNNSALERFLQRASPEVSALIRAQVDRGDRSAWRILQTAGLIPGSLTLKAAKAARDRDRQRKPVGATK